MSGFRTFAIVAIACAVVFSSTAPASAQAIFVSGTVVDAQDHPIADASVQVSGANITLHTTTSASGSFSFQTLTIGNYQLSIAKGELRAEEPIAVTSAGLSLVIHLESLKTIGRVITVTNPSAKRSGTDVSIGAGELARVPGGKSLPSILTQLPSAALGSNGQIHINGDHNGINYVIDGVQVPASLNRVLGTEIDPSDIGYLDVLEGAYPAQYGDKFAAVLNIGTRAFAGPPGYDADFEGGSYNTYDSTIGMHAPLGTRGGSLSFAVRSSQNDWALDPPVTDPVHNAGSDVNQFLRLTAPVGVKGDTLNFDAIHSLQTFQVPPDTADGVPAATDDDEYQNDTFLSLQYRHAIGDHGSLQFGPSFKDSRLLDTNDLTNDLAAAQGASCTDFTDCVFSVFADRTARDYRFNFDYALKSAKHDVRAGALYGTTTVQKDYVITLQPDNALNSGGGTFTTTDTTPNIGHTEEAYLQDSWTMGHDYALDYGLRADAFQIASSEFSSGFSQVSPRVKLTRFLSPSASIYAYYGRLFVPFSFENVSPVTAAALYATPPSDTFDLKPQRDSLYEIGGHFGVAGGDLGLRVSHKVSTDWIDDTQVGATNLHQDINFPSGRVDQESAYYQHPLARQGRFYASLTHSMALNSLNCETNLLQNCALDGPPGGDLVQADHDQHWDANTGVLWNDASGGWFSFSTEYGSGLSLGDPTDCVTDDAVNCKVPPHLVFNLEKGFAFGKHATVSLAIDNLLNDRYAITLDNSLQGTHYARPRAVFVEFNVKN